MGEQPAGEFLHPARHLSAVVVAVDHAARPEHVVGDEESARAQVLEGEIHRLRVPVLVDVDVDDVPDAAHPAKRGGRLLLVIRDARPHPRPLQERPGEGHVLGRELGAVDLAPLAYRAREVQRGVAVPGAELEDASGPDGARKDADVPPDQRPHDREGALRGQRLHLQPDGIAVVVQAAEVLLDGGIDDVHSRVICAGRSRPSSPGL